MKLRAYLVDDEPLALERLRRLLAQSDRVEVVGSTTEPEEAIAALTDGPVDLLFLDIQMPRLNGFEVLSRLPVQPLVIFTTAYDQYALKAFAVNSVDYLLKPIDPEQLERSLNKIDSLRGNGPASHPDLQALITRLPIPCANSNPSISTASHRASASASGLSILRGSRTSTPKTSSPTPSPTEKPIASTTPSPISKGSLIRRSSCASIAVR